MTDSESSWEAREDSFDSRGDDDQVNDLFYSTSLLNHLQNTLCLDTRRIYATGLGQGGGIVHQLACHTHLSRRIAAFALVNAAIYRPMGEEDRLWAKCTVGRRPIPMLEIHGAENNHYPLKPMTDNSISLSTVSAEEWVNDWRELNKCGSNVGRTKPSKANKAVYLTETEHGQLSESITFGGLALRMAFRCGQWANRDDADFGAEEKDLRKIFLLHYAVKGFKHGWPRLKGKPVDGIAFKDNTTVKPLGAPNFDASAVMLSFFQHHRLPSQSTIHSQAKELLIERGAKVYKHGPKDKYHEEL
jgi:poly(3-hydroxybutyrate) depolymerase